MARHNLGPLLQIPRGEGRNFAVAGQEVAVFHARGGALYATQARCPHRAGPLADGLLGGATLVCPLHEWQFDLASGKALRGDCGLAVYPVALDPDQQLLIDLPGE
jgi:nitrite reductase (NADH) small subunit